MVPRSEKTRPSTLEQDLDALLLEAAAKEAGPVDRPGGESPAGGSAGGPVSSSEDVAGAARRLGATFGQDLARAERLTTLALMLHAALAAELDPGSSQPWSGARARVLLHAATFVHDVGLSAGEAGYHKHSYRIVRSHGLAGLSGEEVEIVANIARYHRRAEPKLRHRSFAALGPERRELVCRLASILRVAISIDGSVGRGALAARARRADAILILEIQVATGFALDLQTVGKKSGPFERAFGTALRTECVTA